MSFAVVKGITAVNQAITLGDVVDEVAARIRVLQRVSASVFTNASTGTIIAAGGAPPLTTEGGFLLKVAITPVSATSTMRITMSTNIETGGFPGHVFCVFRNEIGVDTFPLSAFDVGFMQPQNNGYNFYLTLTAQDSPGTTGDLEYIVHFGATIGGANVFDYYGTRTAHIEIEEVE